MTDNKIILLILVLFVLIVLLILFILVYKTRKKYNNQMITLYAVFNSLPDFVYCKDRNLKYTNCNKVCEKYFGMKESEIVGKTLKELHEDEEQAIRLQEIDKIIIKEKKSMTYSEWYEFPDKSIRLMENTKIPLIRDDKVIGIIGIDKDITDQRLAIDNANEASRSKSNFLAKMSHEIRTPMNAIIGMTELALRESDIELIYKHILTVKQAGTHLLTIINDILDFSKIESGKLEILPNDYLFSSLVNDVISIIRMKLIDSQIRFAVNIDCRIPNELVGDETRIRQILLNILTNAVKYTEKGFISFTVHFDDINDENVNLIIEIIDSGKGIKKEDIDKLFGDYVQVDQVKNRGIEGIGLGLAITWSLVKEMGGDIKVYSEYGNGSIFTVTIPQRKRSDKILAKIIDPERKNVIIYERREVYANSIVYSIENLGVACDLVESDDELITAFSDKKYEFLFISYVLMRRNENVIKKHGSNIKIVILTEFGEAIPNVNLNIISMPVYSISIANILNGVAESFNYNENKDYMIKFAAPDARILIVDDINTNLKVAEGLMLPYKMKMDLCKSGKEAINAVKLNRYDLIFMDHKMPEMDGIEATKVIRMMGYNDDYYNKIPIIALTANAMGDVKEQFLKCGFNDFLSKPIDILKLNMILEKWIPREKKKTIVDNNPNKNQNIDTGLKKFDIFNLNVEKGIFYSGGTFENYLDILKLFLSDGLEKINELNMALENDNIEIYSIHIHALKSALANIGADELSQEALNLENAGLENDVEFVKINNTIFIGKLRNLLSEIKFVISGNDSNGDDEEEFDFDTIKPLLDALLAALISMDAGVVNRKIEELVKLKVKQNLKYKIIDLSELILIGEYDKAKSILQNILIENNNFGGNK